MNLHQQHYQTAAAAAAANPAVPESERLLGVAEKLLHSRDLNGAREFALLAQESDPLLEGSDQILAITDVLLASEKRVVNNRHHDWYAILQINRQSFSSDPDILKKNYRRLALLLHPDKNRFPLADSAFKLVADAWALLSDVSRRGLYDHELNVYERVELQPQPQHQHVAGIDKDKLPVRRSPRGGGGTGAGDNVSQSQSQTPVHPTPNSGLGQGQGQGQSRGRSAGAGRGGGTGRTDAGQPKFWTACPYCYVLYEYPRVYQDCCLRCQNCERGYHATVIPSLPPLVPGKEAYYCCWGFFPLGFSLEGNGNGKGKSGGNNVDAGNNNNVHNSSSVFPNWMPTGMFNSPGAGANLNVNMNVGGGIDISDGGATGFGNNNVSGGFGRTPVGMATPGAKKRGRPRKNQ